jgi:hypothetical protein
MLAAPAGPGSAFDAYAAARPGMHNQACPGRLPWGTSFLVFPRVSEIWLHLLTQCPGREPT